MPNFVINHDEMANLAVLSANWHRKEVASSELPFEPLTKIKIKTRGRKMAKLMTLDNDRKSNLFVLKSMMCKLASRKSFLILSLVLLSIGCFGPIKLVASSSSSSPTNFEQSFSGEGDSSNTGSSRLLQIGHQQLQSLSHSHHQQTPSSQQNQLPVSTTFDASNYRSIYEAIRNHPELREFANLCEADAVRGIVSMDKIALTVFAPIDRSLTDLLAKSKSHPINLIELAQHHIVQGFVAPDENTKYPRQFSSYSLLSPLYLNQVQVQLQLNPSSPSSSTAYFVNNARILATHLIPIEGQPDNYQTLHVIDQVIEFAYVNRQTQLRPATGAQSTSLSSSLANKRTATIKRAFNLDELVAQPEAVYEFYERFSDYQANQAQVDLFHARVFKGTQQTAQKLSLSRDQLNLERLIKFIKQQHSLHLRGKLFQVNESSSLNTYFLPINSDELDAFLESPAASQSELTFKAHIVPNQVLFTRTMLLGVPHDTLFNQDSNTHQVTLNLAKTLPENHQSESSQESALSLDSPSSLEPSTLDLLTSTRSLLSSPLLLQSKCSPIKTQIQVQQSSCRSGVTSAEILLANIPLSNGVLHLIKKPILVSDFTNVLDYLNDNDNQLSNVVNSLGSSTGDSSAQSGSTKVNKFRELLARERQMLATFSMDQTMNKTIFAPSDEAFARLRYDLRALVLGDESLIPKHWDASYRNDLLERLVKRHIVLHQTITSDQMENFSSDNNIGQQQILTENGKLLTFIIGTKVEPGSGEKSLKQLDYQVESDSTKARLLHHDLIGSNGVLHIIDRVLGEEQETVYSLLKSIILKYNHSMEETQTGGQNQNELHQMIQSNIKASKDNAMISANSLQENQMATTVEHNKPERDNSELGIISKSIGQYLDDLSSSNKRQLDLLASSVNISYQLARLTSMLEGLDDWNERFKQPDRMFTYFVPSDLAWLKLEQAQPELYRPLMYFLDSNGSSEDQQQGQLYLGQVDSTSSSASKSPRSSESSHRLRKILERHLAVNQKLERRQLNKMDSVQTLGATLRLVETQTTNQHQLTGSPFNMQPIGTFAALHSIVTGTNSNSNNQQAANNNKLPLKSLKLNSASANIVQVNEATNGFVYIIDNVLLLPNDAEYIVQTSATPAISSTMSSLLGGHNSAILDFLNNLLTPSSSNPLNLSANSMLALIGTLMLAISVLLVLAVVLLVRKRRQNKLSQHQQLESGLTSSSSANSGSTSTTKSL